VPAGGPTDITLDSHGEGDVELDPDPSHNGVMLDAAHRTYAVLLATFTEKHCDQLTVTQTGSVNAGGLLHAFRATAPDQEGVEAIGTGALREPGHGLSGHDETATPGAGGRNATTSIDYHLEPRFDLDAWATVYRARYVAARQGRLDAFKDYTPEACQKKTFQDSPCLAAARERDALNEDAEVAATDFKRVARALVDVRCPGLTRHVNLDLGRIDDVVAQGPIATYEAVHKILKRAVVSDVHVSYANLPDYMQCLYDYDTFKTVTTLKLPGTLQF